MNDGESEKVKSYKVESRKLKVIKLKVGELESWKLELNPILMYNCTTNFFRQAQVTAE